jgi:hypothetical protein
VLGKLRRMSVAGRRRALEERMPPEHQAFFEERLEVNVQRPPAVRRRPAARVTLHELQRRWKTALEARRPLRAASSAAEKKKYRERVLADRARARTRMQQPSLRTQPGEQVENSTGLPPAKRRRVAESFERWCFFNSWSMCASCGMLAPRDLTEATLIKDQKVTHAAGSCSRCRASRSLPALELASVPEPLQGLSTAAAQALSPLEIDVGPVVRAEHKSGYRQHSAMMRFRWQVDKVPRRIKRLEAAWLGVALE